MIGNSHDDLLVSLTRYLSDGTAAARIVDQSSLQKALPTRNENIEEDLLRANFLIDMNFAPLPKCEGFSDFETKWTFRHWLNAALIKRLLSKLRSSPFVYLCIFCAKNTYGPSTNSDRVTISSQDLLSCLSILPLLLSKRCAKIYFHLNSFYFS